MNQLTQSAEWKHYYDLLIEHKSNIKKSWQIIKSVTNKRKYKLPSKKFHCNGSIIDDGNMISNKFNNFFVNVGQNLAKSIPSSCKEPSDYISYNAINAFYFVPVTENGISKIIGCFKESAAGWDDIKGNVIKHIKNIACIPLKHICNLSLSLGVFPHELKIANVVLIHKANDDMAFSNYRPVSVLPVCPSYWNDWLITALLTLLTTIGYYMNISLDFRKVNRHILLLCCWLIKSLRL